MGRAGSRMPFLAICFTVVGIFVGAFGARFVERYFVRGGDKGTLDTKNASDEGSGVSFHARNPSSAAEARPGGRHLAGGASLPGVGLVLPSSRPFREEVEVVGLVSPRNVVTSHFLLPGKVEDCRAKVGQEVAAGELLCRLDASLVLLEKERAEAAVASAGRAVDEGFLVRQRNLYESGVIGQGDYERVRVEAERARALRDDARSALALVERKLELHELRASLAGKVLEVKARKGQPISPELPAVVLSSTGAAVIKAQVPARHWDAVKKGTEFRLLSVASRAVEGVVHGRLPESGEGSPRGDTTGKRNDLVFTVSAKGVGVDPQRQTFEVELSASSPLEGLELAPGMLVSGRLVVAEHPRGRVVPFDAMPAWESATGRGKLFIRDGATGLAKLVEVRTTSPEGGNVHVHEGIGPSDAVVHPVPSLLRDGDALPRTEGMP